MLFLALSVISGVVTWKNAFSILPCVASALAVIGFWIGKPKLSRLLSYPISLSMLAYAISNPASSSAAWLSVANEVLSICSSVVGNIRHDFKRTNPRVDEGEAVSVALGNGDNDATAVKEKAE